MKGLFFVLSIAMAGFSFQARAATFKLDTINNSVGFTYNVNGKFPDALNFSAPSHSGIGADKVHKGRIMYSQIFGMSSYLAALDSSISGSPALMFTGSGNINYGSDIPVTPTPIPAASWLFGTALMGLMGAKRHKVT
jgi:hypothetical protein